MANFDPSKLSNTDLQAALDELVTRYYHVALTMAEDGVRYMSFRFSARGRVHAGLDAKWHIGFTEYGGEPTSGDTIDEAFTEAARRAGYDKRVKTRLLGKPADEQVAAE